MGISNKFPKSPYDIIEPNYRWFPDINDIEEDQHNLLPPLVSQIREEVRSGEIENIQDYLIPQDPY